MTRNPYELTTRFGIVNEVLAAFPELSSSEICRVADIVELRRRIEPARVETTTGGKR